MNSHVKIMENQSADLSRRSFLVGTAAAGLALGLSEVVLRSLGEHITAATIVLVALLLIFGSQFTLFAMWFDMESNKDLR